MNCASVTPGESHDLTFPWWRSKRRVSSTLIEERDCHVRLERGPPRLNDVNNLRPKGQDESLNKRCALGRIPDFYCEFL